MPEAKPITIGDVLDYCIRRQMTIVQIWPVSEKTIDIEYNFDKPNTPIDEIDEDYFEVNVEEGEPISHCVANEMEAEDIEFFYNIDGKNFLMNEYFKLVEYVVGKIEEERAKLT